MLVAGAAVAVAIVLASALAYLALRHQLRAEVDRTLEARAADLQEHPRELLLLRFPPPELGGPGSYVQLVRANGTAIRPSFETVALPVDARVREVAAGRREGFLSDAHLADTHVRVITAPLVPGFAVQVARPLTEEDRTLHRVGLVLLLASLGGIALAALLGGAVARAALTPVSELTSAVDHVATTRDLSRRIEVEGGDELARLAVRFNEMLSALEASLQAQQQLVADASHELRTPLTSLRTNIEVLARGDVPPDERERILADVRVQLEELSLLVGDLVELAREGEPEPETEEVSLDVIVESAVERARTHAPRVRFALSAEPTVVRGVPSKLERAVANLLDNAAKWSPAGGLVEVSVRGGEVTVRDHGPGIDPADLPHVFDRFYRAPAARRLPGSGLGLAIVRQVADLHRGTVSAEPAEGGGTLLRLKFLTTS